MTAPLDIIHAAGLSLELRAATAPSTWNPAARTVEVTFATDGARRKLYRPEIGEFWEELGLGADEVDLRRLNSGGPVLNSHGRYTHARGSTPSLEDQVGTVLRAWSTGTELRAEVRLIDRPDLAWFARGLEAGDFQKLSAGYRVTRWRFVEDGEGGLPIYRAIEWTPHEISFLPIAEDAGALVRSLSSLHSETFEPPTPEAPQMKNPTKGATTGAAPGTAPAPSGDVAATTDPLETRSAAPDPDPALTAPAAPGLETRSADPDQDPADPTPATAPPVVTLEHRSAPAPSPAPALDAEGLRAAGAMGERNRVAQITRIGDMAGVPDGTELATRAIAAGSSVEQMRTAALERMMGATALGADREHGTTHGLTMGSTTEDKGLRAIQDGLDYRCHATPELTEGGRRFAGMSLLRCAEEVLSMRGINVQSMNPGDLITRALATTDFPLLLANTANKRVVVAYEGVPRTFIPWATRATATDFKTRSAVRLGAGSAMLEIPETGEIPLGKITEGGESYALLEYGRRIAITRKALRNDDASGFDRVAAGMGARMAELEGDVVYALLTSNPTLSDGLAAFHATHGNTLTTGAPNVAGFSAMRTLMRGQTDEDGMMINVAIRHIVVPPELETQAQQETMLIQPSTSSTGNPFSGSFDTVQAEPRLTDANDWYGFANSALTESIEYAYLAGEETPQVQLEEEFTTSGRQIRILHAFGAGWVDFRGAYASIVA